MLDLHTPGNFSIQVRPAVWVRLVFSIFVCAVFFLQAVMLVPAVKAQNKPVMERALAIALIRDTLAAVNQGNWTGNYTVLRDYASPNFASANDPTRLTSIFQPLRAARLDLLPALILNPVITRGELVDQGQRIRLSGYFPSQPRHIQFDMLFEPVNGRWLLFGVAVAPMAPPPQPVRQNQSQQSAPASGAAQKTAPTVVLPPVTQRIIRDVDGREKTVNVEAKRALPIPKKKP